MLSRLDGLLDKSFLSALGILAIIGLSIFALFSFIANFPMTEAIGFSLFVGATILLILGYMIGIIVVAYLAIFVLSRIGRKRK
jgi:nitrate reductase gamma subunit